MSQTLLLNVGLCTPLGLSARATLQAISAGLSSFSETELMDNAGNPVRASLLPELAASCSRTERLIYLGRRAIADCLDGVPRHDLRGLECHLALPEDDSAGSFERKAVVNALSTTVDDRIAANWSSASMLHGRAGVFEALASATDSLTSGRAQFVLVGGIESMCDSASLRRLAADSRTRGVTNLDGLIPGEGAGFALLARSGNQVERRFDNQGRLLAAAVARDNLPFGQRQPLHAKGLTTLFAKLQTANGGQPRPSHLLSCQSGEGFWERELSAAYLRHPDLMPEPFVVHHIAESLGDVGAASGTIQLAVALRHLHAPRRRVRAPRIVLYGSSDCGTHGGGIVAGR